MAHGLTRILVIKLIHVNDLYIKFKIADEKKGSEEP